MKKPIATLLTVAMLQLPALASAQSPAERAQKYFDDGAAHYLSGDYARAIVDFRKAFSQVENPIFLYNIALAERNLGKCDAAIATATRAIEMQGTDSATSSRSKGVVAGCSVQLSAVRVSETPAVADATIETTTTEQGDTANAADSATEVTDKTVVEPSDGNGWAIAGWTLSAVGVAGLVAGSVISIGLEETYDTYQTTTDPTVQAESRDELETMRPVALGLLVGGFALATAGIVILAFDVGSEGEATVQVTPDPRRPTVTLQGRF